jgi:hypothetical protein
MFENAFVLLAALAVGHAIADYPLQGDFMSKAKSPVTPLRGVPWELILFWHGVIHGGLVWFLTGHIMLGIFEVVAHCTIDYLKCINAFGGGRRGFYIDQALHMLCKLLWAIIVAFMGAGHG